MKDREGIEADYRRRLSTISAAARRIAQAGPASSYQPSYSLPYQRWYKFKEAFSPELVFDFLRQLNSVPTRVCDPFGGSGTTALACQYLGVPSVTIELNPFLCDVVRAKTTAYDIHQVETAFTRVRSVARKKSTRKVIGDLRQNAPKTLIEPGVDGRYVFPRSVAHRILALRAAISDELDESIRRLLTVLLAAALVPASNTLVNGKGRRYRRGWELAMASAADVDDIFEENFEAARADFRLQSLKSDAPCCIINDDARAAIASRVPTDIDVAIFSPPYPNSFDYTDIYNIELWMLGYLQTREDNRGLRLRTLRSHVQIRHEYPPLTGTPKRLQRILRRLELAPDAPWNLRIPDMLRGYFADLEKVISGLGEKMTRGGTIACVVGDSLYSNVLVDVPSVLEEQFQEGRVRFLRADTLRQMSASAQHGWRRRLKESLILFNVDTASN